jgi:hypothetical protein
VIKDLNEYVDLIAEINETVSLSATLYQDSRGVYKEKRGTLTVKQRKRGLAGLKGDKDSFRTVGIASIDLSNFVHSNGKLKEFGLQWCAADGAFILASVTAEEVEDDDDNDSNSVSTGSTRMTTKSAIKMSDAGPNISERSLGESNSISAKGGGSVDSRLYKDKKKTVTMSGRTESEDTDIVPLQLSPRSIQQDASAIMNLPPSQDVTADGIPPVPRKKKKGKKGKKLKKNIPIDDLEDEYRRFNDSFNKDVSQAQDDVEKKTYIESALHIQNDGGSGIESGTERHDGPISTNSLETNDVPRKNDSHSVSDPEEDKFIEAGMNKRAKRKSGTGKRNDREQSVANHKDSLTRPTDATDDGAIGDGDYKPMSMHQESTNAGAYDSSHSCTSALCARCTQRRLALTNFTWDVRMHADKASGATTNGVSSLEPKLAQTLSGNTFDHILPALSQQAKKWLEEINELLQENRMLVEKEDNLDLMTAKADHFENESVRLEEMLQMAVYERDELLRGKEEAADKLQTKMQENECLLNELIDHKMAVVSISAEIDIVRKSLKDYQAKSSTFATKLEALEMSLASGQEPGGGGGGGGGGGNRNVNFGNQQRADVPNGEIMSQRVAGDESPRSVNSFHYGERRVPTTGTQQLYPPSNSVLDTSSASSLSGMPSTLGDGSSRQHGTRTGRRVPQHSNPQKKKTTGNFQSFIPQPESHVPPTSAWGTRATSKSDPEDDEPPGRLMIDPFGNTTPIGQTRKASPVNAKSMTASNPKSTASQQSSESRNGMHENMGQKSERGQNSRHMVPPREQPGEQRRRSSQATQRVDHIDTMHRDKSVNPAALKRPVTGHYTAAESSRTAPVTHIQSRRLSVDPSPTSNTRSRVADVMLGKSSATPSPTYPKNSNQLGQGNSTDPYDLFGASSALQDDQSVFSVRSDAQPQAQYILQSFSAPSHTADKRLIRPFQNNSTSMSRPSRLGRQR